jgi:cytosine/creatinine deaminase
VAERSRVAGSAGPAGPVPQAVAEIRNARLRRRDGLHTIRLAEGVIVAVDEQSPDSAPERRGRPAGAESPPDAPPTGERRPVAAASHGAASDAAASDGVPATGDGGGLRIDAAGGLVTESFVNGHLHLCKVNTLDLLGDAALDEYHAAGMGGAMTAIELAAAVKDRYRQDLLVPGIRRAVERAIAYGTHLIRAFADTDTRARLEGVRAVMQVRDEYRERITIEVVAFPQDGVLRDPGAADWVRRALEEGADAVGGIPWIELTDDDMRRHVDLMMDLAEEFDRPVSMLVDDAGDPTLRTTEMLALATARRGMQGRVTAQHARAMALYPEPYRRRLFALLKEAGIGVVSDPHTGPLHADIDGLRAAGIPVSLGQDDIADAYYPFGRNNMLEVAFLASHLLWKTRGPQLDTLCDMIGSEAARVLGRESHEIRVGSPARLLVHAGSSVREVLAEHAAPRFVVIDGRVVAQEGSLI